MKRLCMVAALAWACGAWAQWVPVAVNTNTGAIKPVLTGGGPTNWFDIGGGSPGGGVELGTNWALWVSSTSWQQWPGTQNMACVMLALPVEMAGESWGGLFGATNAPQRMRMTAAAPGVPVAADEVVVRASWAGLNVGDTAEVWASWQPAVTNTLTLSATGVVSAAIWTNTAGSGTVWADVRVTGNGTNGLSVLPKLEAVWQ